MQLRVGQRAQRLLHGEQKEVHAETCAALAEGRVTDIHAETLAHTLREATGKRQRVSHQGNDDLPVLNLTPRTLMGVLINP